MAELWEIARILNCTQHPILIVLDSGEQVLLPPHIAVDHSPRVRILNQDDVLGTFRGIPIKAKIAFDGLERGILPPREKGVIYIVPSWVCQAYPDRDDLAHVEDHIRSSENREVVACRTLRLNR